MSDEGSLEDTNDTFGPRSCHDCGAKAGELHQYGCDVERCPVCGGQLISCCCWDDESAGFPSTAIDENRSFIIYQEKQYKRVPWTGAWPGADDAARLGFWCKWGNGWERCSKDDPNAQPDLNRLHTDAIWNPDTQRWEAK